MAIDMVGPACRPDRPDFIKNLPDALVCHRFDMGFRVCVLLEACDLAILNREMMNEWDVHGFACRDIGGGIASKDNHLVAFGDKLLRYGGPAIPLGL